MAAMASPVADMSGAADLGSAIDEAFSEATSGGEGGEQQSAPPEPESDPFDDAQPEGAQAAEPEGGQAQQSEGVKVDGYAVDPQGNYIVPKHELPQLQAAKTYAEAVQQKFPTAQDAEVAYAQSSDFQAMMNDMQYGADADVDAMLQFLSGANAADPQTKASMQSGFERMATRASNMLQKLNPQAFDKHVQGLVQGNIDALYQRWQQTGNEEDKLAYQRASWGHTGQYKTEMTPIDPMQQAQEQLVRQQQSLQAHESQLLERDWTSYNRNSVDGPRWEQFNAEIDTMLKPIKAAYAPEVFGALRDNIASQVLDKMKNDFEFSRTQSISRTQIQKGYEQLWRNRQPADSLKPRIDSYQANFMARARQILPSVAKPLIDKAAAPRAAAQSKIAPPPRSPQQPPTSYAANGQPQRHVRKLAEDPEFASLFS
jgi:hypothetical protein